MPYHVPNVTDLGVEELESLETICRNDSVFARKVLHHSIKVVVGNKTYILKAKVLLYRHMPEANPNKFVVRSEVVEPLTIAFAPTGDSTNVTLHQVGSTRIIRHYSDNSTDEYVPNLNLDITINGFELAGEDGTSINPSSYTLTAQDDNGNTLLTFDYGNNIFTWFEVSGLPYITPEVYNNGCVFNINHLLAYDDGYTSLYLPDIFCRIDYLETITYTEGPYNVISTHVNVTANGCQPYTVVSRLFIRP